MNKIETFFKAIKVMMINLIICSLMQNPFISDAVAAGTLKSNTGFEAKDILSLANGALSVYGSYLGQKQQMMVAQITAANNQKLMSQLSPACVKPDGTACYTSKAKIFPECTLPASMSNMPQNVCNNSTPEPTQISSMITYESIAQGWMNYYDQMSNEASNSTYAVGLRCLNDKQKAIDSSITEMMNSLQRLQDRLNQDKQIFRDNNKKLLEDMKTANAELFGGATDLKNKTSDFSKYFSQSCQSVIGKDGLKSGPGVGLNGILQGLSSNNKAAADYNLNKSSIESDVRLESQTIASSITAGGVDDWLNNSKTQSNIKSTKFPAMESVIKKQADELMTARARIAKDLAKVGYNPPALDKNFSVDMGSFITGANDFFKKKYVSDCVTGADKGVAIPIEDVLKNIQQKSTNNQGTAKTDFGIALKKIFDSEGSIDDKMAQVKVLEIKYPGMSISYQDATQQRVTESPYNLFMKTIDKCEQKFAQDDTFSTKGASGVSYKENVARAQASLQELKNLNDSFSSKVTAAITEKVLNCNGESFKAGSDCSEETLKTTSDNFCMNHAAQCANDIQGCYAEANNQVQKRKTKMENLAKVFNANVSAMIARSNALFEQQKAAVTNITQMIQSKFPGTNFDIPKDMFVSTPELKKDTFGVEMAGDGNLASFLDGEGSMPAKIDKLKLMFKTQKDKVKEASTEYINLQKEAMSRERARWEGLYSKCSGFIESSSKALAQMNNEGQKRQGEVDALVNKYCDKYANLRQNPNGGCDQAKSLVDTWDKIIEKGAEGRILGKTRGLSAQYDSTCKALGNEKTNLDTDFPECDKNDSSYNKNLCSVKQAKAANQLAGNGSSGAKATPVPFVKLCGAAKDDKDFIENVAKRLSSADQAQLKDITNMNDLNAKIGSLEDGSATFFGNIGSLVKPEKICAQLKEINSSSSQTAADVEKAYTAKLKEQDDAIAQAEKDKTAAVAAAAAKPTPATPPTTTTGTTALDKPEDPVQTANTKIAFERTKKEQLNTEKQSKLASSEKYTKLQTYLADLGSIAASSSDPVTGKGLKAKLSDLGEQMDESCDAQNTNSVAKNTGGFDFSAFDAGIMGKTK